MKKILLLLLSILTLTSSIYTQNPAAADLQSQEISSLIAKYAQARERQDTTLLKRILTTDVDQLVSSGEWRIGIGESISGMLRSSDNNPGERVLRVEKIRFLNPETAIADARYEIHNPGGAVRKMWSTFIVVNQEGRWVISAIRNMSPTGTR